MSEVVEFLKNILTVDIENLVERDITPSDYFDILEEFENKPHDGEVFEGVLYYYKKFYTKYTITLVQHYGGEGQGDQYYDVYKIENEKEGILKFVKFHGHYDSWNGSEWNDIFFVEPIEKTIIDYVKVK